MSALITRPMRNRVFTVLVVVLAVHDDDDLEDDRVNDNDNPFGIVVGCEFPKKRQERKDTRPQPQKGKVREPREEEERHVRRQSRTLSNGKEWQKDTVVLATVVRSTTY